MHSEYVQAKLKADLEKKLGEQGLTSEINLKTTSAIADELQNRSSIEKKKVEISGESIEAQFPPFMRGVPDTLQVIFKAGAVPDWTVARP